MMMTFRSYDPRKEDKEAVHRIWREAGWLGEGKDAVLDRTIRLPDTRPDWDC